MPYVRKQNRLYFDEAIDTLIQRLRTYVSAGNLNYTLTRICDGYLHRHALGPNYADFNEVVGALECVKLELYRRLVVPYEEGKRSVNGDVYTPNPIDDGTQTDDTGSVE